MLTVTKTGKSKEFGLAKQQFCTCITLFCTFRCRRCTTTTWNLLISHFNYGRREHKTKVFFFFFWTQIQSFRIQLQKKFVKIWRIEREGIRLQWNGLWQKRATCFAKLLQNKLKNDVAGFITHIKPVLQQIWLLPSDQWDKITRESCNTRELRCHLLLNKFGSLKQATWTDFVVKSRTILYSLSTFCSNYSQPAVTIRR